MKPLFFNSEYKKTMKEKSKEYRQASVELCNLVSSGKTIKEAREIIESKKAGETKVPKQEKKKLSADKKKEILTAEIKSLGGELPAENASVAIFQQALDAAKEKLDAEIM